jgi:DNA-binding NtrC family response regulator
MSTKVLLVDDEEEFTAILSERMKTRGLDVDIASTGPAATKKVKEKSYDAIILDLAMPEMDGIATMKHLLKENPDLQVIFLTGHATLEKGIEAVKLGAVEFMEKPVDINKLLEKVDEAKTKKDLLDEKKTEENIKNILKKKGW